MNQRQFVQERRTAWKQFETLLARGPLQRLSTEEISRYSRLLREVSNDLATIRSRDWGQGLVDYLNALVARGHNAFYSAPPTNWTPVIRFLAADFPRLFRRRIGYFLMAAILFFVPGALAWSVIQSDPTLAPRLLAPEELDQFDALYSSPSQEDDALHSEEFQFDEQRTAMAGIYIQHNVKIALECFARGILFGLGTVYTLLFNGITIGAVGGYVVARGHAARLLSFVVSHGSFELTAIALAGGAGLMLGDALIHPGHRTRLEAVREQGLEAVQIALGAAAMLVVAALIEAFWSPAPIPALFKYATATVLWTLVILYLSLAGRGR